jgi:hypothetical protein
VLAHADGVENTSNNNDIERDMLGSRRHDTAASDTHPLLFNEGVEDSNSSNNLDNHIIDNNTPRALTARPILAGRDAASTTSNDDDDDDDQASLNSKHDVGRNRWQRSVRVVKHELGALGVLWREPSARNTLVPLTLVWFFNAFASQIFFWIPLESKSIFELEAGSIEYQINFTISFSSFLGTLLALYLTLRVSRLRLLRVGTMTSACFAALLASAGHNKLVFFLATGCLQACYSVVVNTLYLYSPEVFATKFRVSAFAVCMLGHRIAPTVAPQVLTAVVESMGFSAVCWLLAVVHVLAHVTSTRLTVVTFNEPLVE